MSLLTSVLEMVTVTFSERTSINNNYTSNTLIFSSLYSITDHVSNNNYENALFILNSSAHVLSATNRFDPECKHHLDEVLNQESIHCS